MAPPLDELRRRIAALKTERATWIPIWKEIADHISPGSGVFSDERPNRGKRGDERIIDGEPERALRVLAAGMQSGLTSPSRPWFRLEVPDSGLSEYPPVKFWLAEVQRRMETVFARSNTYNALHMLYGEVGAFGTGAMMVLPDYRDVIRCRTFSAGEYLLALGPDLRTEVFVREGWMTAAQMVAEFGMDAVSDSVRAAFLNGSTEAWFRILHVIEPNDERIEGLPGPRGMRYRSVHFEEAATEGRFLRASGFEELPVMAPRWEVRPNCVYGRGPGWTALGDSKMLQKLQEDSLMALAKVVDPPLRVPWNFRRDGVNILPGGITFVDGSEREAVTPLYQISPDLQAVEYKIRSVKDSIGRTFFNDLFLMLTSMDQAGRRDMTAREVVERHEEKLVMLGPVLERLEGELLDPLIDRTFSIMLRSGLVPPPPEELAGMDLQVEYVSMLAQAQRMVAVTGIEQLVAFTGSLAAVNPAAVDKIDWDQTIDEYAAALGTPPGMVVSDDEVAEIREARARKEQAAQAAQMAAQAAQGAKVLSEADTGGNNALSMLMGSLGMGGGA
jgi:hypothetical protein